MKIKIRCGACGRKGLAVRVDPDHHAVFPADFPADYALRPWLFADLPDGWKQTRDDRGFLVACAVCVGVALGT